MLGASVAPVTGMLVAPAAGAACPGAGPCVVVDVVGRDGSVSASRTYDLGEVETLTDLQQPRADLIDRAGRTHQADPPPHATSLHALIANVPDPSGGGTVDTGSVTYTEVFQGAVSHPLGRGDVGPVGTYGPGRAAPMVYDSGSGRAVQYFRPVRGAQDFNFSDDPNYGGVIQEHDGAALHVVAHLSGRLLAVTARADDTTPAAGQSVQLGADVDGSVAGPAYAWDLGDGRGFSTRPDPAYAWSLGPGEKGHTYGIGLEVRGDDGSWGRSSPLLVHVGPAPSASPAPDPTPGGGTAGPGHPETGPDASPGHGSKGTHGAGTGTGSGGTGPGAGTGGGASGTAGTGTPGAVATTPTTPGGATTPSTPSRAKPAPRRHVLAGDRVDGTLLLSSAEVAPSSTAAGGPGAATAARRAATAHWSLPHWVLLPGVLVLLLALGAGGETRSADRLRRVVRERSPW